MDSPAIVAVPLPMCKARSGRVALQGTSLDKSESALTIQGLFLLALTICWQKHRGIVD